MSLRKLSINLMKCLMQVPKTVGYKNLIPRNSSWLLRVESKPEHYIRQFWGNLQSFNYTTAAAQIRRQATRDFMKKCTPNFCLFSFVSMYLHETEKTNAAPSLSTIVQGIKYRAQNVIQTGKEFIEFPCQLSSYKIEQRLGEKSCNSAVYQADYQGKKCALKIMFNYDTSSSTRICQNFQREYQILSNENEATYLPRHPNIIELMRKFVDNMPMLYDSKESYPEALPYRSGGCGRNHTMFLVMPKYSYTLREYIQKRREVLTMQDRVILFQQLLDGVGHLELHLVSHRDLKSDNILLDVGDDEQMPPKLAITDFGCCYADKTMRLSYETEYIDKGGSVSLLAPEIVTATCGKGKYLDYSKADAWTTGTLAYEIFGFQNPFYTLNNTNYKMVDLPALESGDEVIDHIVYDLLQRDSSQRLRSHEAATILFVLKHAPKYWLDVYTKDIETDINRWILELFVEGLRNVSKNNVTIEAQLLLTFLGRICVEEIMDALEYIKCFKVKN